MVSLLAFGFGTHEIILVLVIVVVLFGATKLPALGSAIGQSLKNFKRGMREAKAEEEAAKTDKPALKAEPDAEPGKDDAAR